MSNNRRVLIVEENSFIPIDTRVWYEVTTLRDAGWDVSVICPKESDIHTGKSATKRTSTPENLEGVTVYRFPLTFAEHGLFDYLVEYFSAFTAIARLSWCVWRKGHFDIIHFCNPPDIFFPIAIFFRLLGARVIFDHHDLFPELVAWRYDGFVGKLLYGFARVTEYLTFRSANVVISTNQSYRQIGRERGNVPAERIVVVRNGPKRDEFTPVEAVLTLKRDFPYMACYAGVMGYEDGVLELLQSIRYIIQDLGRHDILFILLGDGSMRPQALATVKAWGLEDFIDFPGMVRDKLLLRQYLCTADVLLSPEPLTPLNAHSTFIKVGEYMAMGKPIVGYDLVETRYTAQDAAVYVEPGNETEFGRAIVALVDDPERRRLMGESGRQRLLNHLSWEHQQDELFRAYSIALVR